MSLNRSTAFARLSVAALVLFALGACGDGDKSLADPALGDKANEGVSESATVAVDAPTRISLKTGALLQIPEGAVNKQLKVTLERPADSKAIKLIDKLPKSNGRAVSAPYVVTPHGTKFNKNVTLTLPITKSGSRDVSAVWLEDEDDTQWKVLNMPKTNGEKAAIDLRHFSVLMLIENESGLEMVDESDAGADASDAGSSEPNDAGDAFDAGLGEDAGAIETDAGAPDTGTVICVPVPVDQACASTACGAVSDGCGGTLDCGACDGGMDGGTNDAGTTPDGGTGATDAGPQDLRRSRLVECGLLTGSGPFAAPYYYTPDDRCISDCVYQVGDCSDVYILFCSGGDGTLSTTAQTCISGCSSTSYTCPPDGSDAGTVTGYHCDGYLDCSGGEDELGCDPAPFQCSLGLIPWYSRCDGIPDITECPNGEDEQGCVTFMCDGDASVPDHYVCDGYMDCTDNTDEIGCAQIDCSSPPAI